MWFQIYKKIMFLSQKKKKNPLLISNVDGLSMKSICPYIKEDKMVPVRDRSSREA